MRHQEQLAFQDKTLNQNFNFVMNFMNTLISKSVRTEATINIDSPSPITDYGRTTYYLYIPPQNEYAIISSLKTDHYMSSKRQAVAFYVTNKIEIKNEDE